MAKGLGSRQPVNVNGVEYGSKTEAIVALHGQGMSQAAIGELIGSSTGSVAAVLSQQARKSKQATAEVDTDGIWTPEKAAKVRRLFGKTMVYIADAVAVPPAELLKYVLHGVVPPSQKVRSAEDIKWNDDGPAAEPALLPPPDEQADDDVVDADHMLEPSRDDDEAELAALQAADQSDGGEAEIVPPAPVTVHSRPEVQPSPATRFPVAKDPAPAGKTRALIPTNGLFPASCEVRLVDKNGKYLHESLEAFTDKVKYAWKGGRQAFDVVKAQMPKVIAKLQMEVVF